MSFPFYREFYQGQGTAVSGTWTWGNDGNQTNYASVTNQVAGYFINTTHNDLNEYKWSNIFLTKGTYKAVIVHLVGPYDGIAELLFGSTSLAVSDFYNVATGYNQVSEIPFVLTNNKTGDIRFRVNGKNVSSADHYIEFSRFRIEKVA